MRLAPGLWVPVPMNDFDLELSRRRSIWLVDARRKPDLRDQHFLPSGERRTGRAELLPGAWTCWANCSKIEAISRRRNFRCGT